ncbi:MAG TPA: DNA phosphorothioation system sulfurtransferase DndC [Candidatus Paceibacterota bacterium]|nr:DNA phosphorothioation system sulfurtransferase DndC [Verrucomicrobiota bacterium]HRY51563.1 DNA phosphorothioation system sulfurtransferase DndC [Candidatus Paceibacterota bacterium]
MPKAESKKPAFAELGLKATISQLKEEIRELYLADDVPWIVGYSGGKDSTAVLQLTWLALAELPVEQRRKTVHVISTDTMVENPVVAAWVQRSLSALRERANQDSMPVEPQLLHPKVDESFWVNLIGRGYPAPRPQFRWCTERLKIKPSNRFIRQVVTDNGEAILLIGARKAESSARAHVLKRNQKHRVRDRLSPSATLPGCSIYTVIEDWSNDEVWMFLMQEENPWGITNKDLLGMYQGASADGECPLVLDSSTPSCGDSRFGCWVCTLVDKDKSMTAMVQNDEEKEWMMPLLQLRNDLDFRNGKGPNGENSDHHLRDFRRMAGTVQLFEGDKVIPGPYTQESRELWLRKLLEAQRWIRRHGPEAVRTIQLITMPELQEIRRIWVVEKHEMEDSLPRIYQEATGEAYPGARLDDNLVLGESEMQLLREVCGEDRLQFELARELLSVERQQRAQARRAGLFERLEKSISRHYYDSREDAIDMARRHQAARELAGQGKRSEELCETPETGTTAEGPRTLS